MCKSLRHLLFALTSLTAPGLQAQSPEAPPKSVMDLYRDGLSAYQKGDQKAALETLLGAKALSEAGPAESRTRYEVLKALSSVQAAMGDFEGAEQSLERAMNWRERYERAALVDLSPDRMEMAAVLEWRKEYERALALLASIAQQYLRESKDIADPRLADVYSRQAQVFSAAGDKAEAVRMSDMSVRVRSAQSGEYSVWLTPELERLGVYALQAREYGRAEEAYRHALLIRERTQGRNHVDLVSALDGLAYALFGQKKREEAEQVYQRLLKSWTENASPEHPMVILTMDKLAALYRDWGKEEEAAAVEAKAVALRTLFHANGLVKQAGEMVRQKKLREALDLYRRALALLDESRPEHADLRGKLQQTITEMTPKRAPAARKPAK